MLQGHLQTGLNAHTEGPSRIPMLWAHNPSRAMASYRRIHQCVCLSVCLSVCLLVYLSMHLSSCVSVYLSIYLPTYLSIYLSSGTLLSNIFPAVARQPQQLLKGVDEDEDDDTEPNDSHAGSILRILSLGLLGCC